jgi:M6 family metalloprotease-like protein
MAFQISDIRNPGPAANPSSAVNLRSSTGDPSRRFIPKTVVGEQRTLAILVEFTDVKHSHSENEIHQLIFVTMREYWEEVSYGKITVVGKTLGWYSLRDSMAHYGSDSHHTTDDPDGDGETDSWWLIRDAVKLVDDSVNFREYDHLMIVHAGIGQESSSKTSNNIWSVFYSELSISTNDGVEVTSGVIVPEAESSGGFKSALGVAAHEFAHSLGLADLYMYTHRNVETLDDWSLMDHGEWLGSPPGSCPAHLEAWGRMMLGWITPQVMQPLGQMLYLSPLEDKAGTIKVVKIPLTDETYYLIEVRRKVGFDSCLPSEGVLITRIDEGRRSGEGIIRVMDANPHTVELGDAAFQVGQNFEDNENRVYVRIHSRDGWIHQIILARRPIILAGLQMAGVVTGSYGDEVTILARLTDSKSKPLPNMIISFECISGDQTTMLLGKSVTDAFGYASLRVRLGMKPGSYTLRSIFTGGELGAFHYMPESGINLLTVTKKEVVLRCDGPKDTDAFTQVLLRIRTLNENGPTPKVPLRIYVDGRIYQETQSNDESVALVTLSFGLDSLGVRRIRIEVPESELYEKATLTYPLSVSLPDWIWIVALLSTLAAFFFITRLCSRRLQYHRGLKDPANVQIANLAQPL